MSFSGTSQVRKLDEITLYCYYINTLDSTKQGAGMVTTGQINAMVEATKNLTVDELADLVNHLGDGTLTELQKEPWKHPIAHLLPAVDDADAIHTLWVVLISIHDDRFSRKHKARR